MKTQICQKEYYSIDIDIEKNRIYFTILGGWKGIQDFEGFEQLWIDTSRQMQPHYTICSDVRLMPMCSHEIEDLFSKIQQFLIKDGLLNIAEIMAINEISYMQLHRMSEKNKMPTSKFKTLEEAEIYLDRMIELIPK